MPTYWLMVILKHVHATADTKEVVMENVQRFLVSDSVTLVPLPLKPTHVSHACPQRHWQATHVAAALTTT